MTIHLILRFLNWLKNSDHGLNYRTCSAVLLSIIEWSHMLGGNWLPLRSSLKNNNVGWFLENLFFVIDVSLVSVPVLALIYLAGIFLTKRQSI